MAFSGCNLICNNKKCAYFKTGFVLTGIWPLGDVDSAIDIVDEDTKKDLLMRQKNGWKFFKINYPDKFNIPIVAYGITKYCNNCKRIHLFDVKNIGDKVPDTCDNCFDIVKLSMYSKIRLRKKRMVKKFKKNWERYVPRERSHLMSFTDVLEHGIKCPKCRKKLIQQRWFVNQGEAKNG